MRVASAAFVGMTAGVPAAWALSGLLPAAVFGAAAAWWAVVLMRRPPPRGSSAAACAFGATIGAILGRLGSYTWPGAGLLECFALSSEESTGDLFGVVFSLLFPAVMAAIGCAAVAAILRRQAQRWAREGPDGDASGSLWFVAGALSLGASLVWTLANECLWPNAYMLLVRDVCNPDLGPIAIAGYVFSAVGFFVAFKRARRRRGEAVALSRGEHPTLRIDRDVRPGQGAAPWVAGDGPPGSLPPHEHPQEWSAVAARPQSEVYRDGPGVVGFVHGEGAGAAAVARRNAARAAAYLAVVCALGIAQSARSVNLLLRHARAEVENPYGTLCACDKGAGGVFTSRPLP